MPELLPSGKDCRHKREYAEHGVIGGSRHRVPVGKVVAYGHPPKLKYEREFRGKDERHGEKAHAEPAGRRRGDGETPDWLHGYR